MNEKKITVLMPAFNAAPFIAEAIASVLSQECDGYELLVVDDGSTDDTVKIIQSFTHPALRLIRSNHLGIANALNTGLQHAKGEYIARFDADDICLPMRLAIQSNFLDKNPAHIICGGNAEYIDVNGEHLFHFKCKAFEHDDIMRLLNHHCPFIHSSVMYRRAPVLQLGGYPVDAHNFEDHLLWAQMAGKGMYYNLNKELIMVRFNPSSTTIDEKWRGDRFRQLKNRIIRNAAVTVDEGQELEAIIRSQDLQKIREGAYYALCGKKFLVNNHKPAKARQHLSKAIRIQPKRFDNYALYALSYFPPSIIHWLHKSMSYQTTNL